MSAGYTRIITVMAPCKVMGNYCYGFIQNTRHAENNVRLYICTQLTFYVDKNDRNAYPKLFTNLTPLYAHFWHKWDYSCRINYSASYKMKFSYTHGLWYACHMLCLISLAFLEPPYISWILQQTWGSSQCRQTNADRVKPPSKGPTLGPITVLYTGRTLSDILMYCCNRREFWPIKTVLYREVVFVQSVLHQKFHCILTYRVEVSTFMHAHTDWLMGRLNSKVLASRNIGPVHYLSVNKVYWIFIWAILGSVREFWQHKKEEVTIAQPIYMGVGSQACLSLQWYKSQTIGGFCDKTSARVCGELQHTDSNPCSILNFPFYSSLLCSLWQRMYDNDMCSCIYWIEQLNSQIGTNIYVWDQGQYH